MYALLLRADRRGAYYITYELSYSTRRTKPVSFFMFHDIFRIAGFTHCYSILKKKRIASYPQKLDRKSFYNRKGRKDAERL